MKEMYCEGEVLARENASSIPNAQALVMIIKARHAIRLLPSSPQTPTRRTYPSLKSFLRYSTYTSYLLPITCVG